MTLVHRGKHDIERASLGWPSVGSPEWLRRLFEFEGDGEWLRMEEFQDGDDLVVRAELPDVDPDKDVDVTVADGVVHIHAHREQKAEHKDRESFRSEFRYGEFEREIELPKGATAKDVKATYVDGILEVRVPCPGGAAPEPAKVPISRS